MTDRTTIAMISAPVHAPVIPDCVGCPFKVVDEVYSKILQTYFVVLDVKKPNGVVERYIQRGEGVEAAKTMITPDAVDFENSDPRTWKVDNKAIRFHTMAAMVSAPFLVSALSLDGSCEGQSVLELGLGGATTHLFLSDTKPKLSITSVDHEQAIITIAETWFHLKQSGGSSVVLDDGVKFLEKAKTEGKMFDVVIVDTSDGHLSLPAPAAAFLQDDVIENIKAILKPNGAVLMNICHMSREGRLEPCEKDPSVYKKHFPHCVKVKTISDFENNDTQICTLKPLEDAEFYRKRFETVKKALGLPEYPEVEVEIVREW